MSIDHFDETSRFIDQRWFKDFGHGPVLTGTRCRNCMQTFFPPKPVCPKCFDGGLELVPLSRKGHLHTFAQSAMGPPDLEKPYLIGFIDMPEKIKLFSVLTDCEPWRDVLKVGLEMEWKIERIKTGPDGEKYFAYKFKPVR